MAIGPFALRRIGAPRVSRRCTVCGLSSAGAIAEEIRTGRSARSVAAEFGVNYEAMVRHVRNHLAKRPAKPVPTEVDDPLEELVAALRDQALAGNPAIVHQYRLALQAQAAAANAALPVADLASTSEWIHLRTVILDALAPFPEARVAVAEALVAAGMGE